MDGQPFVHPLTEYVLQTFEDDDEVFRDFSRGPVVRSYRGDIAEEHEKETVVTAVTSARESHHDAPSVHGSILIAMSGLTSTKRLAGLGMLFLFGALIALPLWAALALCAMPCCHHETDAAGAVVSGAMAACENTCAVRADQAERSAVAAIPQPQQNAALLAVTAIATTDAPPLSAVAHRGAEVPRSADAPLHVLHSVFRI